MACSFHREALLISAVFFLLRLPGISECWVRGSHRRILVSTLSSMRFRGCAPRKHVQQAMTCSYLRAGADRVGLDRPDFAFTGLTGLTSHTPQPFNVKLPMPE